MAWAVGWAPARPPAHPTPAPLVVQIQCGWLRATRLYRVGTVTVTVGWAGGRWSRLWKLPVSPASSNCAIRIQSCCWTDGLGLRAQCRMLRPVVVVQREEMGIPHAGAPG